MPGSRTRPDGACAGGGGPLTGAVFISYRRADGGYAARSCYDHLVALLGEDQVVLDNQMGPGTLYPAWLRAKLEQATVLLCLIDRNWLARIDQPGDWVRRELERALTRRIPVIPVLLEDAALPALDQLPAGIRGLPLHQFTYLRLPDAPHDLQEIAGAVARHAPGLLTDGLFPAPPAVAAYDAPTALVQPEQEIVDFQGRDAELAALEAWLGERPALALGVLTGGAGAGKTRLAVELCRRVRAVGWTAGRAGVDLDVDRLVRLAELDIDVLLVVDRAESRTDLLAELIGRLLAGGPRARVRVLLAARSDGPWLGQLRESTDERVQRLVDRALRCPVDPLLAPGTARTEEFRRAALAFAAALGAGAPDLSTDALPDLHGPAYEDILAVHLVALARVLAARPGAAEDGDRPDPVLLLLRYERDYWLATAPDALPAARAGRVRQVVAAVTLVGPRAGTETRGLLAALPTFEGVDGGTLDAWVEWVNQLYPDDTGLSPEPVAEEFLAGLLTERPEVAGRCAAVTGGRGLRRMLATVGRAATRRPELRDLLAALLDPPSDERVSAAVTAAGELPDPSALAAALSAVITTPGPLDLARSVIDRLPDGGRSLAPLAVDVLTGALATLAARPEPDLRLAGYLQTNLSALLLAQSHPDEAAAAAADAVTIYRALSVFQRPAYAVPLAAALANQALVALHRPGRPDATVPQLAEAMALFRAAEPPGAGVRGVIKAALVLAAVHARAGRREAQVAALREAVDVARSWTDTVPVGREPGDDRALLAAALEDLALALVGSAEAADVDAAAEAMREAVAERAALAYRAPDPHRAAWVRDLVDLARIESGRDRDAARRAVDAAVVEARLLARSGDAADRRLLAEALECASSVERPA